MLNRIVAQLAEKISGAVVAKIYQPDADILILKIRAGKQNLRLLISAEPGKGRIHLTEKEWLNPSSPPRFCQLLRARISRIESISLLNEDRIIQLGCQGPRGACRLLVELLGHQSNILLIDEGGQIIDLLKRVPEGQGGRSLLPQKRYLLPDRRLSVVSRPPVAATADNKENDLSRLFETNYGHQASQSGHQEFHRQLIKVTDNQTKRLQRRLAGIEQDLRVQEDSERLKHAGELLLTNLHEIRRGMQVVELFDCFQETSEKVSIALDPSRSPQENAEGYFTRYKKARRGIEHTRRRLIETQQELLWLAQLKYQLVDGVKKTDIEEIAAELKGAGLLKSAGNLHARRTTRPSQPRETSSPNGFKIMWGRNNRQNDELSTRHLQPGDLWFHAHHVPGAHVVLKSNSRSVVIPAEDLEFAAAIAAGYSQAKEDDKVEVMYAQAKHVSKPKDARPGLVHVRQYKTLVVRPVRID